MKNQIVKFLLSVMIVFLSMPIACVYGREKRNLYAGIEKRIEELLNKGSDIINNSNWRINYTTSNINARNEPNLNSEIIGIIPFNSHVLVADCNDEWAFMIYQNEQLVYINKKYISSENCKSVIYNLPNNSSFKSFMPYTTINNKSSLQYNLQKNFAYTGDFGIRKVNERYCVAIGTAFDADIGTYLDLILENGTVINCIVSDIKAEKDTLQDNITTAKNGCVAEFVVDMEKLYFEAKYNGNISSCCEEWNSPVITIRLYDKNIFK